MKTGAAAALLVNAFIWGVSWWPFQQLQAQGLHPLWATALVYSISLVCIAAWQPQAWRGFVAHPQLWLLMLAAGLTNVGFNWAVTVGDVIRVVLLFYMMPAWAVLLAWLLLGEKPGLPALLRLALALTGVVVVLKTPDAPWPLPRDAVDALSLMGGFCFALTNILLRRLAHTPSPARMLAMFGGGAVLAAAAGLAVGGLAAPPALDRTGWVLAAVLTLGFLASNLALQYGAARLTAGATALIMLSEIVFASGSSALLGAAELTSRSVLGGALILLAALLAAASEDAPGAKQDPQKT
ncbi:MAG: DMT family transporter [Burkholderiaceae bacterium]